MRQYDDRSRHLGQMAYRRFLLSVKQGSHSTHINEDFHGIYGVYLLGTFAKSTGSQGMLPWV